MPQIAPLIFDYLDLAQFLQDHFKWRKGIDPKFSYSVWSSELGIGSKTLLRFILQKKRLISPKVAHAFKSNLRLNDSEAACFDVVLSYSQSTTTSDRQAHAAALLLMQRRRYAQKLVSAETVAHNVLGPVILTLLTFKDVPWTFERLSELLRVDSDQVEGILRKFEANGLIQRNQAADFERLHRLLRSHHLLINQV